METNESPYPKVHSLAQEMWHSPAVLIGNKGGLCALKNAIDAALLVGEGNARVFCEDGEGYVFLVACREDMSDAPLGYTDADCCAKDDREWPEWLVGAIVAAATGLPPGLHG